MNKIKAQSRIPDTIKMFAVITAMPRWVVALLQAEGFVLPTGWHDWWIPTSALFGAAMAVVEGLAFTYVFNQWKKQRDLTLGVLAIVSGLVFVVVLTPVIAASVVQMPLADVLTGAWLYGWSASVALSTIIIVASVGYAQSVTDEKPQSVQDWRETVATGQAAGFGKAQIAALVKASSNGNAPDAHVLAEFIGCDVSTVHRGYAG